MRVVFMGTPEFAVPSLRMLHEQGYELAGAFTQPDRPQGRGNRIEKSPIKRECEALGIPVFQFERVRRQEGLDALRALRPDVVITAAFGQILSKKLLEVPKMGTINVHASLLPRHRGAAPINWAIIQGETITGVTTMLTDAGLDTGDMLLKRALAIGGAETAGELTARLSELGAQLLRETLEKYAAGEIVPEKQDEAQMSYEPMLNKGTGLINWRDSAHSIDCLVRGVNPWPGAYTYLGDVMLKIWRIKPLEAGGEPGRVLASSSKEGLIVGCGTGSAEVLELQLPGGRRMAAKAYLAGKRIECGSLLGEENG